MYARLIAAVREQVYVHRTINADVLQPDCESFVAELSESTKNRDLWKMSAAVVTFLAVKSSQDAG